MYESTPKERKGKPLHSIVAEAIESTASTEGEKTQEGGPRRPAPQPLARTPLAFAAVATLAVIEALVIVLLIAF